MDRVRKSVDLNKLISHTFPFEKLHDAMETAVTKKAEALKVMLTF
jgi:threonine dehydrogenase-like Zn-dependent dehydrogenase